MRKFKNRSDWLQRSFVYLWLWWVSVVVWWGPFAYRALFWGQGESFTTSASFWCKEGPLGVIVDRGFDHFLLMLCMLFVALEWALSRHFRVWLIFVVLAIVGIPAVALAGNALFYYGSGIIDLRDPHFAVHAIFVASCAVGVVLDVSADAVRRRWPTAMSSLTSVATGFSLFATSAIALLWWRYEDDAFCGGWQFLLFLWGRIGAESQHFSFHFSNAPFARAWLLLLLTGLAIGGSTIVLARLLTGDGKGRTIKGLMLVTALVAAWMSLFVSWPRVKQLGLRHRVQEALPHLSAFAAWREDVRSGRIDPVPSSFPPEFQPYLLKDASARLPFPCPVQVAAFSPPHDEGHMFTLQLHPGYYLERWARGNDPGTYREPDADTVHGNMTPEVVELGDGWHLTYRGTESQ